jgi:hypothetical protein
LKIHGKTKIRRDALASGSGSVEIRLPGIGTGG